MAANKVRMFEEDELESHLLLRSDVKTKGTGTLTYEEDWQALAYDDAINEPLGKPYPLYRRMTRE